MRFSQTNMSTPLAGSMDPSSKLGVKHKAIQMLNIVSDKTSIAVAKLTGEETAEIDVAIVKATLQDEAIPKEKHVIKLKELSQLSQQCRLTQSIVQGLTKRLEEADGWMVALKSLIVFHRLFREANVNFQEECLKHAAGSRTGHLLRRENFADHTSKITWDHSTWVRCYSSYLDERLRTFGAMKWTPERTGLNGSDSTLKSCSAGELLECLPQVLKLLGRLAACSPEGAAAEHPIVMFSFAMVLKELNSVYKFAEDGVHNLTNLFFEMERGPAIRALEMYKEHAAMYDRLNGLFAFVQGQPTLGDLAADLPQITPAAATCTAAMEAYVRTSEPGFASALPRRAFDASRGASFGRQSATSAVLSGGNNTSSLPPLPHALKIHVPDSSPASPQRPSKTANLLDLEDEVDLELSFKALGKMHPEATEKLPRLSSEPSTPSNGSTFLIQGGRVPTDPFAAFLSAPNSGHFDGQAGGPVPSLSAPNSGHFNGQASTPVSSDLPPVTLMDDYFIPKLTYSLPTSVVSSTTAPLPSAPFVSQPADPFIFSSLPYVASATLARSQTFTSSYSPLVTQIPLGMGNPFNSPSIVHSSSGLSNASFPSRPTSAFSSGTSHGSNGSLNKLGMSKPKQEVPDPLMDLTIDLFTKK